MSETSSHLDPNDVPIISDYDYTEIKSKKAYWYTIRIRPTKDNPLISMEDVLKFPPFNYSIIAEETAKYRHFHLLFGTNEPLYENIKNKRNFAKLMYEFFDVPEDIKKSSTQPKITNRGNSFYSCSAVKKFENAGCYAVKDGLFLSSCSDLDELTQYLYLNSYSKPAGFKKDQKKIFEKYQNDEIREKSLWVDILNLRASYDLDVKIQNVDGVCLGQKIKKYPNLAEEMWDERQLKNIKL